MAQFIEGKGYRGIRIKHLNLNKWIKSNAAITEKKKQYVRQIKCTTQVEIYLI